VVDPGTEAPVGDTRRIRFDLKGRSLREHAARGTVVNAAFMIGLAFVGLARGLVMAAFVSRADYGVWGLVIVSVVSLLWLRQLGVGDKFIQQDEEDQRLAYQKAFTLELALALVSTLILAALMPVFALVYGEWRIVPPGLVLLLVLPPAAFATPLWIYYRQMRFVRQRLIQAVDPVVSFVVMVALAVAGAGYWSFVIGLVVGSWAMALVAMINAPIPMRLRRQAFQRETLGTYFTFSWPLFVSGAGGLVLAQTTTIATEAHLGIAAVGALALASNLTQFADRVQQLVTTTLYPAICAVKERTDLLRESLLKSNRLGMMWGMPFGVGLSLFCSDLVDFGIGDEWEPSVTLLQVTGLVVAISQIFMNWDAYFRARAETKPMAVASWAAALTFVLAGIPLLIVFDLKGLALAIGLQGAAHLVCRVYFLHRLFGDLPLLRHALSGVLPIVPGVVAVLGMRLVESGARTGVEALAELAVFILLTAAATWSREAPLLREAIGYLFPGRKAADAVT
jgi:O-antigen/teichoic acid export membrane protein